jgi:deazaflavin-dependent oxidoreductase (nitroreductase family)
LSAEPRDRSEGRRPGGAVAPDLLARVAGVVGNYFAVPSGPGNTDTDAQVLPVAHNRDPRQEHRVSEGDELRQMMTEFNQQIVEEFRQNAGVVGGPFEGAPMVLLHTTGAKSGQPRLAPLVYRSDDDRVVIFGSKGGAPTHPDWYHNLVADPRARVEIGSETFDVAAYVATGEERERLWTLQKEDFPGFAEYEQKTDREIPVVVLERIAS